MRVQLRAVSSTLLRELEYCLATSVSCESSFGAGLQGSGLQRKDWSEMSKTFREIAGLQWCSRMSREIAPETEMFGW
jgi:hypothetical protein